MSDTDYYGILNVKSTASLDEIKTSYKKLVKKYHPDKNTNNEEAVKKYVKIQEAYEILSDEKKREIYDKHGDEGIKHMDIFGANGSNGKHHIKCNQVKVDLTLEEIYSGVTKKVSFKRIKKYKEITIRHPFIGHQKQLIPEEEEEVSLDVKIEAGISRVEGEQTIIPNQGDLLPQSTMHRDVMIVPFEIEHKIFKRGYNVGNMPQPANLYTELNISFLESICGFKKKLKHVNGKTIIVTDNDELIANGDLKVYKNYGLPVFQKPYNGDLIIKFIVSKPNLTTHQKEGIKKVLTITKNKETVNKDEAEISDEETEILDNPIDLETYKEEVTDKEEQEDDSGPPGVQCAPQ